MANQNQQQIKMNASEDVLKGAYANAMQISHTKEEFILDFFLAHPPQGQLASRVITSPGHAKRIVAALQQNIKNYEEKFGEIKEAEGPKGGNIGFSA
ncbi:MAG: DUF3467 domain-containing protein [Candidatus Spechtbacterales bacterium]|nr:DUF3467 domain-containing protein [Candidatus Spechtbacterales bacterium]